jgi:rhamnosyltransferase
MIFAIIVTFNPGLPLIKNIRRLERQLDNIIVVDNTPDQNNHSVLDELGISSKVILIRNHENVGLASALNQGIEFFYAHTNAWVFTFDQDSVVPEGYVTSMISNFGIAEDLFGKVGVIAPIYQNKKTKSFIRFSGITNKLPSKIKVTLTSGSLFKVSQFKITGLFAADYFIDYIDYEYCLRLNQLGYSVVEIPTVILEHELGDSKIIRFLGRDRLITQHSSTRRYYKTRNRIKTYRKYLRSNITWVLNDVLGSAKEFLSIILYENDKFNKIINVIWGIVDGLKNVSGSRKSTN